MTDKKILYTISSSIKSSNKVEINDSTKKNFSIIRNLYVSIKSHPRHTEKHLFSPSSHVRATNWLIFPSSDAKQRRYFNTSLMRLFIIRLWSINKLKILNECTCENNVERFSHSSYVVAALLLMTE